MFQTVKNIHFVGIGGSGMSGLAEVLYHSGYRVSGSDIKESSVTDKLKSVGIKVFLGHNPENVSTVDVVVVSSAINKHNPELLEAQRLRIPLIHRSEMLAELMRMKHGIVVAGTHGKTTTTSIIASALHHVGLDPTIVIGGKINSFENLGKLGSGELFIAEADESDGSFLRLTPTVAVITNIDKDHLDYYGTLDEIVLAFEKFVDKVPFYGIVCLCIDDPIVQLISQKIRRKIITFGARKDADITLTDIVTNGFYTTYTPIVFGKKIQKTTIKMPGVYNAVNSLASFAVAHTLDLDMNKISIALSKFDGIEHRFSLVGEEKETIIIDDYAHNPKKIETVLKGTKESFPQKNILAIFQPHRYSRLKLQLDEFSQCFKDADNLIITPVYAAGEKPIPGISVENLAQHISVHSFGENKDCITICESFNHAIEEALTVIKTNKKANLETLVITLGAGDVRLVGLEIFKRIKEFS